MERDLEGQVALVAGATRGCGRGIAVALGERGATVVCTGRSSRRDSGRGGPGRPFDLTRRPEVIEDTADQVDAAGGRGIAVVVDHRDPAALAALADRIRHELGRLDVLVVDLWGQEDRIQFGAPIWQLDAEVGLGAVTAVVETHARTLRAFVPLVLEGRDGVVIEVTDGDFGGYRGQAYYDLAKVVPTRLAYALWCDLLGAGRADVTSVAVTPGFLRSEAMLEHFGVTEANWQDAVANEPMYAESETPRFVGRGVAALCADPARTRWSGRTTSSWELARAYDVTDVDGRRPDWGNFFDEVVEAAARDGDPSDAGTVGLVRARWLQIHQDPARAAYAERLGRFLRVGSTTEPQSSPSLPEE